MNPIDAILNKITMYRLLVYTLGIYAAYGVILAFMGRISASPTALVISLALTITAAYVTDRALGRIYKIPSNMESALISALIIFLIVQPANSLTTGLALVLAGAVAAASKFILAWQGKHLFNPAAFAAAVLSLTGLQATTWWVGGSNFWPLTLLLGLAIVRKVRRFSLFLSFIVISIGLQAILFAQHQQLSANNLKHTLIASPLIFLSTIMLTEPATMPPRRNLQMVFGALVGVLYVTAWQIGSLIIYPEVALLIGNTFAFIVSPKFRMRLELKEVQKISENVYSYIFKPERRFTYVPGQYMEWTLPHVKYDSRGNRRTFTIASSPTEPDIRLGVKFYEPASMFKISLHELKTGDIIDASQLAGNFTLNGNEHKKLAFIAGGIGITPFRSMAKYLTDREQQTDAVLLYAVSDPAEFAFAKELREAAKVGIKTIPVITKPGVSLPGTVTALLDASSISQLVPDYSERMFYISGPNAMVDATKRHLQALKVSPARIKTDHFSGY